MHGETIKIIEICSLKGDIIDCGLYLQTYKRSNVIGCNESNSVTFHEHSNKKHSSQSPYLVE